MKFTRVGASLAMTAVAALALSACATNETPANTPGAGEGTSAASSTPEEQLSGSLSGSGSSAQGTAQSAWIAGYSAVQPDVTVEYTTSSSGEGKTAFESGQSLFAGSDSAYKADEISTKTFAACKPGTPIVEVPNYISPIAIAYKLEGVKDLKLDADTIAAIFKGEITKWNDPKIADLNAGVSLPDLDITAVHRSDKSGTTKNFTDYLAQTAKDTWGQDAADTWPEGFGGEAAQGTNGVQSALGSNGAIGYLDASAAGDLSTAQIKVGDQFVAMSPEGAAKVVDASQVEEGREATDLAYKIDRKTTEAGAYPLVLVSYLIACSEYAKPEDGKLVQSYFRYVVSQDGQTTGADEAHSAPISDALRTKIETALDEIK